MLRPRSLRRFFRTLVTMGVDAILGIVSFAAALALVPSDDAHPVLFIVSLVIALAATGFYTITPSPRHRPTLLFAIPLQIGLIALAAVFLGVLVSAQRLVAVALFETILLSVWRRLLNTRWARRMERVVLVGAPEDLAAATADRAALQRARVHVDAQLSLDGVDREEARRILADADEVIDVSPLLDERRRLELLMLCGPRGFCFLPSHSEALLAGERFHVLGDRPLGEVSMRGEYGAGAIAKRTFDILGASLLLILIAPLLAVIALLLLVTNGRPVFLRQRRMGRDSQPFGMWKLRTMHVGDTTHRATEGDARMTPIGRVLRRYRLDELPQILNVLTGDMSLVGPRPEVPEITEEIIATLPAFALRLCARPGLAGLAQVSAEYDQSAETKLTYDLQYLCSWSMALDIRILLQAVTTALSGRGL